MPATVSFETKNATAADRVAFSVPQGC